MKIKPIIVLAALMTLVTYRANAQNWLLDIRDNAAGTPNDQVNGDSAGMAILYATLYNFTGTPFSDDGSGNPAPATTLDFAGFGFTLNPGQTDLESLFTPAPGIPGFPSVAGSTDGSTPGSSGYVTLGMFDTSALSPGIYAEDFTAGAYADDPSSTIQFGDIAGTLTLDISATATPEPTPLWILAALFVAALRCVLLRRIGLEIKPV